MLLEIDYKHKNEKSDIVTLAKLINNIPSLGDYVGELYLIGESLKEDKNTSKEERKDQVNDILDEEFKLHPILKKLDQSKIDLFKRIWINLYNKDNLSELLEELIRIYGPISLKINTVGYSRESRVYCTKRKNNFDVIFFENEKYSRKDLGKIIQIESIAEFHECKTNVCNFFPADKNQEMKKNVKNKFDFMKDVRNFLEEKKYKYKIYIPTFYENVEGSQEYLNYNGYEYITIIPYSYLIG